MSVRLLSALLVPADAVRPLAVRVVRDSAAAISDLLGGVLLDDAVVWSLDGGVSVAVYQGEDRAGLPVVPPHHPPVRHRPGGNTPPAPGPVDGPTLLPDSRPHILEPDQGPPRRTGDDGNRHAADAGSEELRST